MNALKPHCVSWMPGTASSPHQQVEDPAHQVTEVRLADAPGAVALAGGDDDLVPVVQALGQADHFLDGRAQVGVGEGDTLALGRLDPDLDGAALPPQRRQDQADRRIVLGGGLGDLGRAVGAAVHDDQHFVRLPARRQELADPSEGRGKAGLFVVGGDHQGQRWIGHQTRSRSTS